jgi:hypothetical protein
MLAIIGSLVGFLISFAPELLRIIRDKKDKKHELRLIDLQMEAMKFKQHAKLEEVQSYAATEEGKYTYLPTLSNSYKLVEITASLVRPVITYGVFLLYVCLKVCLIYFCLRVIGCTNQDLISRVWTEEDAGLFCGVITFWFGQRSLNKVRNNGEAN